jgi:hypothetical protein
MICIKRYKGRQRVLKVESCSFEGSIFQMADTLEPYWSLWRLFSSSSRNPCSCVLKIFLVLICHCTKKAQSKQASSHHFQNFQVWLPGKNWPKLVWGEGCHGLQLPCAGISISCWVQINTLLHTQTLSQALWSYWGTAAMPLHTWFLRWFCN